MPSFLAPFRVRSYRFQWPADLLTSWAMEMEMLILGWYIIAETGSVVMLSVYGTMLYTGTLIAPVLGMVSDRVGHRTLLSGMRAIYAVIACCLMTAAFAGWLSSVLVCVLAAVMGIVRPSDLGLRGALIAETMPFDLLTAAMGLSRGTFDFARIGGALSGAAAFTLFGIAPAYVLIVCIYALSALLTLGTTPGRRAKGAEAVAEAAAQLSPWSDFREGIRYIWNTPPLLAIVWLAFLFNLTAYSITNGLLPYVAREVYHVDQNGLGWLVASFAFGAFLGAITLSRPNIPFALPRLLVVWGVVWLLLMLAFAQVQSFAAGMICLTLAGFASNIAMVPHSVILLRSSDRRFRGRVLGVRMLAIYSLPLGLLIAGALIEHIGFRATVTLYAVTGIVFLIVIALRWRIYHWQLPADGKTP